GALGAIASGPLGPLRVNGGDPTKRFGAVSNAHSAGASRAPMPTYARYARVDAGRASATVSPTTTETILRIRRSPLSYRGPIAARDDCNPREGEDPRRRLRAGDRERFVAPLLLRGVDELHGAVVVRHLEGDLELLAVGESGRAGEGLALLDSDVGWALHLLRSSAVG